MTNLVWLTQKCDYKIMLKEKEKDGYCFYKKI